MSAAKSNPTKPTEVVPSLTAVLGVIPILPGEVAEQYQQGLQGLIQELEAKTVMQVYLAEKIFECLWWMRRYEQQKRATLTREMARILCSGASYKLSDDEAQIMDLILSPDFNNNLKKVLSESVYTEHSLIQEAFANKAASISNHNEQITVLAKTLAGFQVSYEVLSSRKLNLERLRIQNELLSKDLLAIELETPDAG